MDMDMDRLKDLNRMWTLGTGMDMDMVTDTWR
jgi:hypothetical protein